MKRTKKQRKLEKAAVRAAAKKIGVKYKYKYKVYERGEDGSLTLPKLSKAEHRRRFTRAAEAKWRKVLESFVIGPIDEWLEMAKADVMKAILDKSVEDVRAQCDAEVFADMDRAMAVAP